MTAAISDCLYKYYKNKDTTNFKRVCFENNQKERDKKQFLLVNGDISGVQNFIYTITTKRAMKALRGRSAFLEFLCENIADSILEKAGTARQNLFFTGGGNFSMILANTEDNKKMLKEVKNNINSWFMRNFNIQLYLEINTQECSSNEIANDINKAKTKNLLGDIYRRLSLEITKGKLNRYTDHQLKELFDPLSRPNELSDSGRECKTCKTSSTVVEEGICNYCKSYEWLGEELTKLNMEKTEKYVVITEKKMDKKSFVELPNAKGDSCYLHIVSEEEYEGLINEKQPDKPRVDKVYSINNLKIGKKLIKNLWMGNYSTKPSGGKNKLIEFSELVKRSKGIRRLGVLRADIDNLGMAFVKGFVNFESKEPYKYVSITRSSVLSRKLTEFFKQSINHIAKTNVEIKGFKYANFFSAPENKPEEDERPKLFTENKRRPRDIVLVYSGGDDVFAIGTWDDIIEFAVDLRRVFEKYTQGKLTFSAGIGMFKDGFPVAQMAEITGNIEKAAKNNEGKDSIAILTEGQVFKWEEFIGGVIEEKYRNLLKWFDIPGVSNNKEVKNKQKVQLSKSVLYKFMSLTSEVLDKKDSKINIARFAYSIARLEKTKENSSTFDEMKRGILSYLKNKKDAKQLLTAFWLLVYRIRDEG